MLLLIFLPNLGMGGSEAAVTTSATNRIVIPRVQARNMLLSTINRTMIPAPTLRNIKPKVN